MPEPKAPEPSPLAALGLRPQPVSEEAVAEALVKMLKDAAPTHGLQVVDGDAMLDGMKTSLNEAEAARVRAVVVGSLQRVLREKQKELAGLLPKRSRRKSVGKAPGKKKG